MVSQIVYQSLVICGLIVWVPYMFEIENSQDHDIHAIDAEFREEYSLHFTIVYHVNKYIKMK